MSIRDTLQNLIAEDTLTAKAVAHATGRSVSTVYRWIASDSTSRPDAQDVRQMIARLDSRAARDALVTTLLAGTGYRPLRGDLRPEELDTNQDGKTDLFDVAEDMHRAIELWQQGSRGLSDIRREGEITDELYLHMQQTGNNLIHEMEKALATITELRKRQPKRRKAK